MSVQPIDKGAVKFKLIFHNTNKEYWIDPPIGWDKMPIELKRGEKYSRQIKFAEDKEVEFWAHKPVKLGHQFSVIRAHHLLYGDECFIELVIYVDDEVFMRAELDFKSVITDRESYFKTKLIVNDLNKLISDLEDVKVDVFGNESLKGNYNAPATSSNVTLMPKKILERNSHVLGNEELQPLAHDYSDTLQFPNTQPFTMWTGNPWGHNLTNESEIGKSYYVERGVPHGYLNDFEELPPGYTDNASPLGGISNFTIEQSADVLFEFKNVHIKLSGSGRISVRIAFISYENSNFENVVNKSYKVVFQNISELISEAIINESFEMNIPKFTRVIYELRVQNTPMNNLWISKDSMINANVVRLFPATNSKMSRLIHVGEKILSNYSEGQSQITAPRFYEGGEFWWHYITSGSFIRGFADSTFDLSFKDWKEFIQNAFNCDVQVNGNNVFIGRHEDFYTDKEIARFPFKAGVDSYEISFNEDLIVNNLKIAYENFEDDKKETLDAFHTESEWYIPKRNKGELSIDIGFTADGYSIEYARREGIDAEPTTAKQKDDDIYIVDCMINRIFVPPFPPFIEGGYFDILQNRQNQGFDYVNNIFSPETAYNLRLSLKRLLLDNYSHRIAEVGQKLYDGVSGNDSVYLKNTYFKSNGELQTSASISLNTILGDVKDNAPLTKSELKSPLITNEIYSFKLAQRMKYNELISLYNKIINERGYVSIYDKEKTFKFYPFEMSYDWNRELLTFKAERKYEI